MSRFVAFKVSDSTRKYAIRADLIAEFYENGDGKNVTIVAAHPDVSNIDVVEDFETVMMRVTSAQEKV